MPLCVKWITLKCRSKNFFGTTTMQDQLFAISCNQQFEWTIFIIFNLVSAFQAHTCVVLPRLQDK